MMATAPADPVVRIERNLHQICTADGTPYPAWATARLWVADADPYDKTDGNAVTPFTSGEAYYIDLAKSIGDATRNVCMLGWQINWDVMLVPGKRLYDVLLEALKRKSALKAYILPWKHTTVGSAPDTCDPETKAVLESINAQLGGKPRIFVTPAREMSAASAGLEMFYSHHQKQVVIDDRVAYIGGIDVCWGRRDNATYELNAETRLGDDAYNGCVPHLAPVAVDGPFVDARAVSESDVWVNPNDGSTQPNLTAQRAKMNLANGCVQRPQGGAMLDAKRQPRMPWQDIQLKVEGPAVSDLASNFVLRWNSVNLQQLRLPLPPVAATFAKPGTCSVQMLRSASHTMVEAELKSAAAIDKPRVHASSGHNHIHHAYVRLIEQAEHFIYIENQFFVSAYGRPGYGDNAPLAQAPSAEILSATSSASKQITRLFVPGDSDALPTNRICEALGEKFSDMILDVGHLSPDGKASPFHVYITLPVHSEGKLNDPSTMTQVHNTMQTLVFGSHSLVNRIRRAIKARQLLDQKDNGYRRVFDVSNTEYTQIPIEWCWAYLTLLNLRTWDIIGGHPVTEQIYVHTKMMVVDDRFAIVGSANINDRSQLGNRDSELALLVMDTDFSYEDIGCPDGPTVVRKFARELRMRVWEKIFGMTGGVRAATDLADAVRRPAAQESWEAIRKVADENTDTYDAAFPFIPANGRRIWPTIAMKGTERVGGRMPFDDAFWTAPQFGLRSVDALKELKGYITLLPWTWTAGQNNNSGMHSALFVENETRPLPNASPPIRLGSAEADGEIDYPA